MKKRLHIFRGDTALWVVFLLLCCISLIEVFSTIGLSAITDMHSSPIRIFFTRHVLFVTAAILIVAAFTRVNYRIISKAFNIFFWLSLLPLIWVTINGTRWISIFGFSIQPSELTKILLMVTMARNIVRSKDQYDDPMTFRWLLIPAIIVSAFIAPENLSTSIIVIISSFLMLGFGGVNKRLWRKYFLGGTVIFVILFAFLYFMGDNVDFARSSTWGHRLQAWINPNPDELTQENMARMAIARGGFWGTGFGTTIHGRLMTQAHNDFIFAIIIEEHGLIWAIGIFILYALFYFRCMRIVMNCKGQFGRLCVAGISTLIYLQAIINMFVAVGVMPVTGQTLPFISYGGSSFLFLAIGLGIIQSVAFDNKKTEYLNKKNADSILNESANPTAAKSATDSSTPIKTQEI